MDFAENKQQQKQQEQVRKTRLDLGGGVSHEFGMRVDNMDMFDDKERMSKNELRTRTTTLQTRLNTQLSEGATFSERRATETDRFHVASARLCKDTVWFRFTDSPEMMRVKKSVNFLNNFLDLKMERYIKMEGQRKTFDTAKLKEELDTAFDEAHSACVNYVDKKDREGKARKRHGIRRKQKVMQMINMLEEEKPKYDNLVEAIKFESLTENSVEKNKDKSPRELSTYFRSSVVLGEAQWQNEGNSTDVYYVKIKENGQDKEYYLKRNLPLISADINGFLDRRISQLKTSRERNGATDPKIKEKVEHRLSKAGMEDPDYQLALDFLGELKKKRDKASMADKSKVDKTITNIFRHDFDRMFNELQAYNTAIDYAVNNADTDWTEISKSAEHPLHDIAVMIVRIQGEKAAAGEGQGNAEVKLEKKDALQWMLEKLKEDLDDNKDADIIRALTAAHQADTEHGLEKIFCVMLGKEVELFGQMRDRGKGDEREQSAANNSGVYRIAEITGLTDVVTASDIRIVRFTDRDGNTVEDFCTVTEAAKGAEFLTVLKNAGRKKIDYTPDAIRQLMRLQALDTVTRQVDRHGRNLKCEYEETNGRILIKNIMSYDQDMSFAEEELKDTFKVNEKDGSLDFQGFLPPMTTKIKKDSAFFKYLKYERFKMLPDIVKNAELPHMRHPRYISDTKKVKMGDDMSLCYPFLKHWELADEKLKIVPPADDYDVKRNKTYGKVFRIPSDDKELTKFNEIMGRPGQMMPQEKAGEPYEVTGEALDEVSSKLGTVISDIRKIVIRGDSQEDKAEKNRLTAEYKEKYPDIRKVPWYYTHFKTQYTKEEKEKLCEHVYELNKLYNTYDFRYVSTHMDAALSPNYGQIDLWIQQFIYFFTNAYKEDPVVIEKFLQLEGRYEVAKPKDALIKELQDKDGSGDITLPTYLHYDEDAYEGLKKLASDDTVDLLNLKLKALDFNERKILMNKARAKEMLAQIDEAKKKAEIFYKLMGWTEEPQCKFFLKQDDYKKFKDINELAVDPGKTYLSIDNRNYIYGVKEYAKYASDNEFEQAFAAEKKKRHDPKRWDDQNFGRNARYEYEREEIMRHNPLRGNISKVEDLQK
ncbi:MAG: hypothetical protein J6N47_06725 [Lachnospiraceae bacterium]|nr:hypothetical protein [Lachnospiraceae bacterium]